MHESDCILPVPLKILADQGFLFVTSSVMMTDAGLNLSVFETGKGPLRLPDLDDTLSKFNLADLADLIEESPMSRRLG